MTHSVAIPQDIIYKIIAELEAGNDRHSLKQCALVSSSFLIPSRKQLFSKIPLRCDRDPHALYQFLNDNPVIQSFVRRITITHYWEEATKCLLNNTSLPGILRLPFCCLESFTIYLWDPLDWSNFSSELKDALSNIIHSTTLKTLYLKNVVNVPITLFLGNVRLTKLELDSISPSEFDGVQSSSPTPAASLKGMASHTVIDQCIWKFWEQAHEGPTEPIFLPFMCCLRSFEIHACATKRNFDIMSFVMRSLFISLTSPDTLEHIKFGISIYTSGYGLYPLGLLGDLRQADVWRYLDSIITHPVGSRLQTVDIDITFLFSLNDDDEDDVMEPGDDVSELVRDALPFLREKGILFVRATMG